MNAKTLTSALLGAIAGFVVGWIVFGTILIGYYHDYMSKFPGLLRESPMIWSIAITELAWGLILAYVFSKAGVKSVAGGISMGIIIMVLAALGFDVILYSQLNLIDLKFILMDLAGNAVRATAMGAVVAWWLGRGNKTTS